MAVAYYLALLGLWDGVSQVLLGKLAEEGLEALLSGDAGLVLRGNCVLVRTKCDTWMQGHVLTIDQEIGRDRQQLKEWGIGEEVKIYKTSASGGFDNDEVCEQDDLFSVL